MGVLPDWMIARDVKISPASEGIKREGKISYGYTSYGYDARVGYKFKVFSPINATEIDPKNFDPKALVDVDLTPEEHKWETPYTNKPEFQYCPRCGQNNLIRFSEHCVSTKPDYIRIPPHSFVLAETIEEFTIPRDCLCIVLGKSTYARCGLIVNVTPGEPEWCGKWTVEISNTTDLPARVYCGEGIMQCIFLRSDGVTEEILKQMEPYRIDRQAATCKVSYADKKGKYQNQEGLTIPAVDKTSDPGHTK